MIKNNKGNILKKVTCGYIIHGCNAQGVMGSGIAKQIKDTYPQAYLVYRKAFEKDGLTVGQIIPVRVSNDLCIINAITQKYYGREKNVVYISYHGLSTCFIKINRLVQENDILKAIHFPKIGCGLANGNWEIVSNIIDNTVANTVEKTLWEL